MTCVSLKKNLEISNQVFLLRKIRVTAEIDKIEVDGFVAIFRSPQSLAIRPIIQQSRN